MKFRLRKRSGNNQRKCQEAGKRSLEQLRRKRRKRERIIQGTYVINLRGFFQNNPSFLMLMVMTSQRLANFLIRSSGRHIEEVTSITLDQFVSFAMAGTMVDE